VLPLRTIAAGARRVNNRHLHKGDVVAFDFTIEHPVAGRRGDRRTGIGVIADNEVNHSCWPPGYSVSVQSAEHYKPGTVLAVTSHNLRKLQGS
jgi:hypothetical protein